MPSGYDNLMQTVARQQATIDRLLAQVTESQTRLAELQAQVDDQGDLRLRLARAEDRADSAQRTAEEATRRATALEAQGRDGAAGDRATAATLARLEALVTDLAARPAPNVHAEMGDLFARLAQTEDAQSAAAARMDERLNQVTAALLRDVGTVRAIGNTALVIAEQTRAALDSVAANLAEDIAAVDARRAESGNMPDDAVTNIMRAVDTVAAQFWQDPVLATSRSMGGLQVPDTAILGLAATKLTNLVTAWNAQTGYSAASVTTGTLGASVVVSGANVSTGDVPQAQMQTNVIGAVNAVGTGMSAAVVTTGSLGSGRMSANVMAAVTASGNDLALGAGQKAGFYGTTPPAQQSVTVLTNNVTSGGSANTISDYSDLSVYANDAATIRNNLFRLGEQVNLLRTAIRNYGFLS